MSSDDVAVAVRDLGKRYEIYENPRDRLKQMMLPRLRRYAAAMARGLRVPLSIEQRNYYREFWALRGVTFTVRRGESVAIVGRNGAGKSTLLQIVCGTLSPTSGVAEVRGRVSALLELGSGFHPDYTGRDNVYLYGQLLGMAEEEVRSKFDAIADFADIGDFIDQPIKTYSSGMVVRLAFAVAINVDPDILVVDEALAVGDVGFQARCFAKIGEMRKSGMTLLFVSHSPSAVTQLCDRAALLDRGEMILIGGPYQAIRAYNYLAGTGPRGGAEVRAEVARIAEFENEPDVKALSDTADIDDGQRLGFSRTGVVPPHFDQHLFNECRPNSYRPRGGEIRSTCVCDPEGNVVNVLPVHDHFTLVVRFELHRALESVRVGWVLKTPTGLIVGGGASHHPGAGVSLTSQLFEARSEFVNVMAAGVYLIDINLRARLENDDEIVHAVTDAVCIKSISYRGEFRNGFVDCLLAGAFSIAPCVASSGSQLPMSAKSH